MYPHLSHYKIGHCSFRDPSRDMTSLKTNCWLQWLTMTLALLSGVPGIPVDVAHECTAPSTAKYRLTFTGQWTQTAFPKHYPLYRPPAQWSPIIGEWAVLICKKRVVK